MTKLKTLKKMLANKDLENINKIIDSNYSDINGELLINAILNKEDEITRLLIEETNQRYYNLALPFAIKNNDIELVKILLPKCNRNNYNKTLFQVVKNGNTDILKILINTNFITDKIPEYYNLNNDALYNAITYGNLEMVKLLLPLSNKQNIKIFKISIILNKFDIFEELFPFFENNINEDHIIKDFKIVKKNKTSVLYIKKIEKYLNKKNKDELIKYSIEDNNFDIFKILIDTVEKPKNGLKNYLKNIKIKNYFSDLALYFIAAKNNERNNMDFFNYLLPHCNINKIKLYNIIIKKTIGLDQEIIEAINDFEFNSKLKKELKEEINNSENNKKRKM